VAINRVIIVGAGYAGSALARALDGAADVCLIEARDCFVHNVAAIRAVVDPSLVEKILIPYDKLLRRGSVLHGKLTSIGDGNVTLADSVIVEDDIIVVATGSHYTVPFKPQTDAVATFTEANRSAHAAIQAATKIAIVGGGAVGGELAGEIATAYPKKSIALKSASKTLLPAYSQKLSKALVRKLKAKEVSLHLGVRARSLTDKNMPFSGYVETDGGNIEADLIFPAAGAHPVSALLHNLPGSEVDILGPVKVDEWLRPAGAARILPWAMLPRQET
jgi:apoptosis-inducing factor 2